MPEQPLVSIIIPTYNRAHLIGETLDSLLAQTYRNWECLVVDDGSLDNTDDVMSEYLSKDIRFQYHCRPKDRLAGGNAARNYGFEMSKGEYVNWLDSDDIMDLTKLETQMNVLKNKKFNFSVCEVAFFKKHLKNVLEIQREELISKNVLFDFIRKEVVFFTPAPLFKKSFLLKYFLKFDEKLQSSQEWELFCRVLYHSPNYHAINKPLVFVRKHENSIRSDNNDKLRDRNFFISRNKVLVFLKEKKLHLPQNVKDFFANFFMRYYVKQLFQREVKRVVKCYFKNIYYNFSLSKNIEILLYSFIVLTTGKGYNYRDRFLKK